MFVKKGGLRVVGGDPHSGGQVVYLSRKLGIVEDRLVGLEGARSKNRKVGLSGVEKNFM